MSQSETNILSRQRLTASGVKPKKGPDMKVVTSLLALFTRGGLTPYEEELLSDHPGDGRSRFIWYKEELFPNKSDSPEIRQLIDTLLRSGSPSLFCKRVYLPGEGKTVFASAGLIETGDQNPIIVGELCPNDSSLHEKTTLQLSADLNTLRTDMPVFLSTVKRLNSRLSTESASLLINRTSGRVAAVNDKAVDMLGLPACDILACEFGELKGALDSALPDHKIRMDRFSCGGLRLALFELTTRKTSDQLKEEVQSFLTHKMRNKLAAIITSHSLLNDTNEISAAEKEELQGIVQSETSYLMHLFTISEIALASPKYRSNTQRTLAEYAALGKNIFCTDSQNSSNITISISAESSSLQLPSQNLPMTICTILNALTNGNPMSSDITMHVRYLPRMDKVQIGFRILATENEMTTVHASPWKRCASLIAKRSNYSLTFAEKDSRDADHAFLEFTVQKMETLYEVDTRVSHKNSPVS